jgi:hypothetical protein
VPGHWRAAGGAGGAGADEQVRRVVLDQAIRFGSMVQIGEASGVQHARRGCAGAVGPWQKGPHCQQQGGLQCVHRTSNTAIVAATSAGPTPAASTAAAAAAAAAVWMRRLPAGPGRVNLLYLMDSCLKQQNSLRASGKPMHAQVGCCCGWSCCCCVWPGVLV